MLLGSHVVAAPSAIKGLLSVSGRDRRAAPAPVAENINDTNRLGTALDTLFCAHHLLPLCFFYFHCDLSQYGQFGLERISWPVLLQLVSTRPSAFNAGHYLRIDSYMERNRLNTRQKQDPDIHHTLSNMLALA